jgi:hypothetical protein
MATTTNYGWTTPDNTALVKDGASAIRTLGSSVDTTVKALSPGTTAGDVDYYTSSTAKARLGIGTTGQVLSVSGGVPAWATIAAGSMTLLSTTTLSGASTPISSISGSYNNLQILIYGVTNNTANGNFSLSFNALGNNNTYSITQYTNNGTTSTRNSNNEHITLNSLVDQYLRTSANNFISLNINNYASATTLKSFALQGYYVGVSYNEGLIGGGGFNSTAAINQIVLSNSGGTFSAGTCLIYGVK